MFHASYTVPANRYYAATKAEANAQARLDAENYLYVKIFCANIPDILGSAENTVAETFSLTGGVGPFTWEITSGALPEGISASFLDDGRTIVISGTPVGTWYGEVNWRVVDTTTTLVETIAVNFQIMGFTSTILDDATEGTNYSFQLTSGGGSGSGLYKYELATGNALPAGLTLSEEGLISGLPTVAGVYTFDVLVTDL